MTDGEGHIALPEMKLVPESALAEALEALRRIRELAADEYEDRSLAAYEIRKLAETILSRHSQQEGK